MTFEGCTVTHRKNDNGHKVAASYHYGHYCKDNKNITLRFPIRAADRSLKSAKCKHCETSFLRKYSFPRTVEHVYITDVYKSQQPDLTTESDEEEEEEEKEINAWECFHKYRKSTPKNVMRPSAIRSIGRINESC